ncbi:hypothetical protein HanXRQr2_Chr08g0355951 [Helianthus annuus]|uniref:Uncharacterized protein n=1 Tax=Helianthus annuus TaxID=4232 RepID=A0A9K3IH89_HELAN|nr:hypothetical protein HanXRQr2_Chr08g0355951 [Helianthus annuus]KAJ0902985.1 hypothetical protein HanPSC8_Chr08g0343751 [Helianthus annuus]
MPSKTNNSLSVVPNDSNTAMLPSLYYTKIGWLFPKSVHHSLASSDDKYLLNYLFLFLFDPPVDPFQLL